MAIKKILLITSEFPPGPGGIGNHAFNLSKFLKINNVDVKVLTVSDYTDADQEAKFDSKQNFKIVRFERYKSRVKTSAGRLSTIKKTLKEERFTHIIFSGRYSLMISTLLMQYHKDSKFIAIVHGGDINAKNPVETALINKALKNSDLIIPVSNYSKSYIHIKIDLSKVIVIPNGFDFENIENLIVKEKNFSNGNLNLITVGTVWPRKGHHNVFKALPQLMSAYPHLRYEIVGRLADTSIVKKFFDDEKFKNNVKIHGSVSNSEMHEILNQSQIFILLSENQSSGDFEGFGIAVLEANYFGLPAIGSKNSGLEDSISDGVSGILVNPGKPDEVFDAVKNISSDYKKYSEGAKQWAMKHHWSNIIKRYLTAIESIN